jgi:hypothetical protein
MLALTIGGYTQIMVGILHFLYWCVYKLPIAAQTVLPENSYLSDTSILLKPKNLLSTTLLAFWKNSILYVMLLLVRRFPDYLLYVAAFLPFYLWIFSSVDAKVLDICPL